MYLFTPIFWIYNPDFNTFALKESASPDTSYFEVSPFFMAAVFKDNNLEFFRSRSNIVFSFDNRKGIKLITMLIILQSYLLYQFKHSLQDDLKSIFFHKSVIKTKHSLLHHLYQKSLTLLSRFIDWSNFLLHSPISTISTMGLTFCSDFISKKS